MNRASIAASLPVLALALLLTERALAAEGDEGVYVAQAFVTGQGLANRAGGFARAFVEVLVKVSGDRRLAQRPEVAEIAGDAASDVVDFTYHDRMSGIPVHDEQGSRDRPFDLTVRFDPAKIDAALAALGSAPWRGPRPKLTMIVAVRNGSTAFVLASDGDHGRDMRDALEVAARRFALPVVLPETKVLAQSGIEPQTLPTGDEARAAAACKRQ